MGIFEKLAGVIAIALLLVSTSGCDRVRERIQKRLLENRPSTEQNNDQGSTVSEEKERPGAIIDEESPPLQKAEPKENGRRIELAARQEEGKQSNDSPARRQQNPNLSEDVFFLGGLRPMVLPEDFSIGVLQKKFAEDEDERLIYQTVETFFDGLVNNSPDMSLIQSSSLDVLGRIIEYGIEKEHTPEEYRIGRIEFSNDLTAHVVVRLFSGTGETSGEIIIEKTETSWYISNILMDFSLLSVPVENDEELFEPSIYSRRLVQ